MRVPMIILALVAAPLIGNSAEAQRGRNQGQNGQGQNGQGGGQGAQQQGQHRGNNRTAGATITGVVYNDVNNNMMRDPGEAGLAGWTITLTGVTTVTATTSATGAYSFSGVTLGNYVVCAVAPAGWAQTSQPNCWSADVTAANSTATLTGFDFGAIIIAAGGAI